jgi:hypothetical protein
MSTEANAPKSLRDNAEATNAGIAVKQEALENRAAREQAMKGVLPHGGPVQGKLLEAGKIQRRRGYLVGKVAKADGGDAEDGSEAEHGRRQRVVRSRVRDQDL